MDTSDKTGPPPIYIVSGGTGASGDQLVHTVLAQFPESEVQVITLGHLRHLEQVEDVVGRAAASGGTLAMTLSLLIVISSLLHFMQRENGDSRLWILNRVSISSSCRRGCV